MPTAEAQLILSCKATGTAEIKKFNDLVMKLDTSCKKLIGDIEKMDLKLKNLKSPKMNNAGFSFTGSSGIPGNGKFGQLWDYEKEIKQKSEEIKQAIARTNQEAMQGLQNVTKEFDKFAAGAKIASKGTEELNFKMIAAKAAGRAFGFELGEGTAKMAKLGVIAAGVVSAIKVLNESIKMLNNSLRDQIYWLDQGVKFDLDKLNSEKLLSRELKNTFETLRTLNEKENLSNVDRLKIRNIVDSTRESFKKYGIALDIVSGKVKNLNEAEIAFSESAKQKKLGELNRSIQSLQDQAKAYDKLSAGGKSVKWVSNIVNAMQPATLLFKDTTQKGVWQVLNSLNGAEFEKAAIEASKLRDQIAKLKIEQKELEAINPSKNIREMQEARQADIIAKQKEELEKLTNSFKDQMKAMQDKIKIQDLINRGLSAEAKKLETITDLMKQFPGFSKDQINQLYKESLRLDSLISQQKEKEKAERNAAISKREQERTAERLAKQAEQEQSARAAIVRELAKAGQMFKQTAELAIDTNSLEAIKLQSRRLFAPQINFEALQRSNQSPISKYMQTPIMASNPQTVIKQQIHTLGNKLEKVISLLEAGNNNTMEIKTEFSKIQTTTY